MASSAHVGPIVFADRMAREKLERDGWVVTFRRNQRTTGDTWYRYSRTGPKQGDVSVRELCPIDPAKTADLRPYARDAGFATAEDWIDAIRDLNGGELRPGYLYEVRLLQGDEVGGSGP